MAATDLKKAGLEPGCKVEVLARNQIKAVLSTSEAERMKELHFRSPWTYEGHQHESLITIAQGTRHELVHRDDVQREYGDAQKARHERFYKLIEHYPHHVDNATESDTLERYCGISAHSDENGSGDVFFDYGSHLADTFNETADLLADEILSGWLPEAIFDLDTGNRIDLHVSTPVISKSEDQGVIINVLDAKDEKESGPVSGHCPHGLADVLEHRC